jgi:hypothetical protein
MCMSNSGFVLEFLTSAQLYETQVTWQTVPVERTHCKEQSSSWKAWKSSAFGGTWRPICGVFKVPPPCPQPVYVLPCCFLHLLQISPPKPCVHFSPSRACHIPRPSRALWLSTNHESFHYAVVSCLLLLHPSCVRSTCSLHHLFSKGIRGGAVDWGTALQTGRSRVRFPMESLTLFSELILPVAFWPWGRLSL